MYVKEILPKEGRYCDLGCDKLAQYYFYTPNDPDGKESGLSLDAECCQEKFGFSPTELKPGDMIEIDVDENGDFEVTHYAAKTVS
jgi:hypothetical protein